MVLTSTSVHVVEQAPQNGYHECLCPQGEVQLPPTTPGNLPRSVGGSDPGSFQITASALGATVYTILCVPFKSGVSISHSPQGLLKESPTSLQSQILWVFIFPV